METKDTRRSFLAKVGVAGAAVGAGATGLGFAPAVADTPALATASKKPVYPTFKGSASVLDKYSRADFAQHLNSEFRIVTKDQYGVESAVDLTLVSAEDGRGNDPQHGYECFSLLFHGPKSRPLPQENYAFSHPRMGKFDLFIVPVGQAGDVVRYEAIFNRLRRE